jgi:hypothetical protein
MSVTEILEELPRLLPSEREKVSRCLNELQLIENEETPDMLAAIDSGRRSVREGRTHTLEEIRGLVAQWTSRSS